MFVAEFAELWNICGIISGVCCCFGRFLEHLPGIVPTVSLQGCKGIVGLALI